MPDLELPPFLKDQFAEWGRYAAMTAEQVRRLPAHELPSAIFGYVLVNYPKGGPLRHWLTMPRPLCHCHYTTMMEAEVCNGGIIQLLYNKSTLEIEFARRGYLAMGAIRSAQVMAAAKRAAGQWSVVRWLFGGIGRPSPPATDAELAALEELARNFLGDATDQLATYVRAHAHEIWS